jgi:hypothetical protein
MIFVRGPFQKTLEVIYGCLSPRLRSSSSSSSEPPRSSLIILNHVSMGSSGVAKCNHPHTLSRRHADPDSLEYLHSFS